MTSASQFAALGLPLVHAGKVRELYALPDGNLLMVASDNVSAFDYVLSSPIPDKGAVLTQISLWWFDQMADLMPNHVISTDVPELVAGRAIVCEPLAMVAVECVARGYLTGSGWAEYRSAGTAGGIALPAGLHDGSRLPSAIFTPATKAPMGEHDENITFEQMCHTTGVPLGERLRASTLAIYERAERLAAERGIILADTKVEFGRRSDGTLVLADELLTPDSSRFWDADAWRQGRLDSFDKQYLRDWLRRDSGWSPASGEAPPPLPDWVVEATRERYLSAFARLTGRAFEPAGHA